MQSLVDLASKGPAAQVLFALPYMVPIREDESFQIGLNLVLTFFHSEGLRSFFAGRTIDDEGEQKASENNQLPKIPQSDFLLRYTYVSSVEEVVRKVSPSPADGYVISKVHYSSASVICLDTRLKQEGDGQLLFSTVLEQFNIFVDKYVRATNDVHIHPVRPEEIDFVSIFQGKCARKTSKTKDHVRTAEFSFRMDEAKVFPFFNAASDTGYRVHRLDKETAGALRKDLGENQLIPIHEKWWQEAQRRLLIEKQFTLAVIESQSAFEAYLITIGDLVFGELSNDPEKAKEFAECSVTKKLKQLSDFFYEHSGQRLTAAEHYANWRNGANKLRNKILHFGYRISKRSEAQNALDQTRALTVAIVHALNQLTKK